MNLVVRHALLQLPSLRKGRRSCQAPVGARRFVIRATHERGVGVPSSRSLATASREANSVYEEVPTRCRHKRTVWRAGMRRLQSLAGSIPVPRTIVYAVQRQFLDNLTGPRAQFVPNRKHRDRNARALIVGLLVVGFVVTYWWAILAALAVAVADCLVWCRVMHRGAAVKQTRREHAALAAPADQQHLGPRRG